MLTEGTFTAPPPKKIIADCRLVTGYISEHSTQEQLRPNPHYQLAPYLDLYLYIFDPELFVADIKSAGL